MTPSRFFCAIFIAVLAAARPVDGALSWGTFLGADWGAGEERMRNDLGVFLKNNQRICTKDVEKLCANGRYVAVQTSAYMVWSDSARVRRHMYKKWEDVPLGFGIEQDACLREEVAQSESGMERRLIPKCLEWMEKVEGQFEKLRLREKGDDRREAFVVFSTVFACLVAGGVGYVLGIFLGERDDLFSSHSRDENKKLLMYFGLAMSVPVAVILWASPRLLMLMAAAFGIGRGAQFFVQKRRDREYSAVSGSESGLVFAAVPISMD